MIRLLDENSLDVQIYTYKGTCYPSLAQRTVQSCEARLECDKNLSAARTRAHLSMHNASFMRRGYRTGALATLRYHFDRREAGVLLGIMVRR